MSKLADSVFKPRRSAAEAKSDTTTRVARDIQDAEVAAREAKTKRLREARLAQEADEPAAPAKTRKKPAARKKT